MDLIVTMLSIVTNCHFSKVVMNFAYVYDYNDSFVMFDSHHKVTDADRSQQQEVSVKVSLLILLFFFKSFRITSTFSRKYRY